MVNQPNILFILSDQQHWQAAGFAEPWFNTPNLDKLASHSTVFENAFCSSPQCSPSRSSILTGFYPSKTGVMGNVGRAGGNPLRQETIGLKLQRMGYHTAYFGKWHLGKEELATAGWNKSDGVTGHEMKNDEEITACALKYINECKQRAGPFALFVAYNNPHDIYDFSPDATLKGKRPTLPRSWHEQNFQTVPDIHLQFMNDDQGRVIYDRDMSAWECYRELYSEKVALFDRELGRVLDSLESHEIMNRTIVLVTSDGIRVMLRMNGI